MDKEKIMISCDICGASFQYGPHIYNGKQIKSYQLTVCKNCWDGNWDGWGPGTEQNLISHLQDKGIPVPNRNKNGWLPRE